MRRHPKDFSNDTNSCKITLNTSSGVLQVDAQNDSKYVNTSKDQSANGQFDDVQSSDSGAPDLSADSFNVHE